VLEAPDHDPRPDEIHIAAAKQGHLADAKAVEIGYEEDQVIPRGGDRPEESANFLLA